MDETATTAMAENGTAADTQQSAQTQPPQQSDISGMVTKESRKAVEKLLRDAGITPDDNPEMQLKEYKKWLDGQKSDLDYYTIIADFTQFWAISKTKSNPLARLGALIQAGLTLSSHWSR